MTSRTKASFSHLQRSGRLVHIFRFLSFEGRLAWKLCFHISNIITFWKTSRTKPSFSHLQLSVFEGRLERKRRFHIFSFEVFGGRLARKFRFRTSFAVDSRRGCGNEFLLIFLVFGAIHIHFPLWKSFKKASIFQKPSKSIKIALFSVLEQGFGQEKLLSCQRNSNGFCNLWFFTARCLQIVLRQ